mmetsp:Transcript_16700/g.36116  ORF Transcript_16700/g.36116 Transcript_16700/m.36116 type:complete len:238 (+) Transcript_16700:281-994(+)
MPHKCTTSRAYDAFCRRPIRHVHEYGGLASTSLGENPLKRTPTLGSPREGGNMLQALASQAVGWGGYCCAKGSGASPATSRYKDIQVSLHSNEDLGTDRAASHVLKRPQPRHFAPTPHHALVQFRGVGAPDHATLGLTKQLGHLVVEGALGELHAQGVDVGGLAGHHLAHLRVLMRPVHQPCARVHQEGVLVEVHGGHKRNLVEAVAPEPHVKPGHHAAVGDEPGLVHAPVLHLVRL